MRISDWSSDVFSSDLHFHQMDVAFIRGVDVQRDRTERRIAGFLEDNGLFDMAEAQTAEFDRRMRRQQAGAACTRDQLGAQCFPRTMRALARIGFTRDPLIALGSASVREKGV